MSLNSKQLNEQGHALCGDCRKKFFVSDLDSCAYCDKFVCKSCARKKNGFTACKKC